MGRTGETGVWGSQSKEEPQAGRTRGLGRAAVCTILTASTASLPRRVRHTPLQWCWPTQHTLPHPSPPIHLPHSPERWDNCLPTSQKPPVEAPDYKHTAPGLHTQALNPYSGTSNSTLGNSCFWNDSKSPQCGHTTKLVPFQTREPKKAALRAALGRWGSCPERQLFKGRTLEAVLWTRP